MSSHLYFKHRIKTCIQPALLLWPLRTTLTIALLLAIVSLPCIATAAEISIVGSEDAIVSDFTGTGVFTDIEIPTFNLSIRRFIPAPGGSTPADERSLVEFDVSSVGNTGLNAAWFDFYLSGVANSNTRVDILAYPGDGSLSLADATQAATIVGSYQPDSLSPGVQSVPLNSAILDSLINAGVSTLEFRLQGIDGTNTQLGEIGTAFGLDPTLRLDLVPEPTTWVMLLVGSAAISSIRRRKRNRRLEIP